MTMVFSRSDFEQVKEFVVLSAAIKLRVQDAELEPVRKLLDLIPKANPSLGAALANFLAAYDSWYDFHCELDAGGKAGNLSTSETEKLMALIEARDNTRLVLIQTLGVIQ